MREAYTRRDFLRAAAAVGGAWCLAPETRAAVSVADRPNIVLIMADDMGYSDIGCYGGEIETPNLDRLASGGLRFTQFYNNAKCAPTRASLLTGLYAQQMGVHDGPVPMQGGVTIAEVLRAAGYRTLMAGKWHAAQLPVERGFDRYFGLCDGCSNYFNPGEQRPGEPAPAEKNYPRKWARDAQVMQPFTPEDRNFYATDAFTDAALGYLDEYGREDRPFFLYLAFTAPHYPLHARPEDIEKYRGRYTAGWDKIREVRYKRMIDMGLIDPRWALSPRDPHVPAWENAGDKEEWDLKMAVYAAMVDRMDQNIGRVLAKLDELGKTEDTLILFLSDNGGCAETRNATPDVPPGPLNSYRTVDPPWANVQNTPFRKYKRYDHEGGISTPLIARWPKQIAPGTITQQMGHLIDVMATCLDVTGAAYPAELHGAPVLPLEGKSLLPILQGRTREEHEALYWQFSDSRAIRHGKWKLVKSGDAPWELYDMEADRTELHDLATEHPRLVMTLESKWQDWARRCGAKS